MIKEPINYENIKINVFLRDGTTFIGKAVAPQTMAVHESIISFWDDDVIKGYPMDLVEHFEYTFDA